MGEMAAAPARNLRIVGTGEGVGGRYKQICVMGEGSFSGSFEAEVFKCTGDSTMKGGLDVGRFRLQGEMAISGDLVAQQLKVMGELDAGKNIFSKQLRIRGMLNVAENCESDHFFLRGACSIRKDLYAPRVDIRLYGPSQAAAIEGGDIEIRLSKWKLLRKKLMMNKQPEMAADSIVGDSIYLEYTEAYFVRGNRVVIGPGCQIGVVEYRESFDQNKSASVRHNYHI